MAETPFEPFGQQRVSFWKGRTSRGKVILDRVSSLIVTSRTAAPRTAAPLTVTPLTVATRTATPLTVTPLTVATRTATPLTVTPLTVTTRTVVPRIVIPRIVIRSISAISAVCMLAAIYAMPPIVVAQDNIRRDPYGNPLPPEQQPPKIQGGAGSTALQTGADSTTLQTGTNSTTLQTGTNSTTLQTGTNSTTLQTGTQSTLLETGTKSTLLNLGTNATKLETGTAGTLLQTGIERKIEPQNVLILMDCSSTMKLALDGSANATDERLNAAKETLRNILRLTPPDVRVGLRVFGNRGYRNDGQDCKQSFLLEPIGLHNRGEMVAKANLLKANGLTPLAYALSQAPSDFEGLEGTHHIILISDGADTCKSDPCSVIRKLRELGFKMRVDVVGVDKKAKIAEGWQMECIAKESNGKYFEADTAAKMANAVNQSMLEAISRNVADQAVSGQVMPKPQALKATPAASLDKLK